MYDHVHSVEKVLFAADSRHGGRSRSGEACPARSAWRIHAGGGTGQASGAEVFSVFGTSRPFPAYPARSFVSPILNPHAGYAREVFAIAGDNSCASRHGAGGNYEISIWQRCALCAQMRPPFGSKQVGS